MTCASISAEALSRILELQIASTSLSTLQNRTSGLMYLVVSERIKKQPETFALIDKTPSAACDLRFHFWFLRRAYSTSGGVRHLVEFDTWRDSVQNQIEKK